MFLCICECVCVILFSDRNRVRMLSHFTQWRIFAQHMVKVVYSIGYSCLCQYDVCVCSTFMFIWIRKNETFRFQHFCFISRFCDLFSSLLFYSCFVCLFVLCTVLFGVLQSIWHFTFQMKTIEPNDGHNNVVAWYIVVMIFTFSSLNKKMNTQQIHTYKQIIESVHFFEMVCMQYTISYRPLKLESHQTKEITKIASKEKWKFFLICAFFSLIYTI